MRLQSVNIGTRQSQPKGREIEITGIYKQPAEGEAVVTRMGIVGDFIGDVRNHGGPDQAVYVYGGADYEWWAQQLGHRPAPGTFGENLTVNDLESAGLFVGDRLLIGAVLLEVSAARIPCSTLARRMRDVAFAATFRTAERPGAYCRVITPGVIKAGAEVIRIEYDRETITLLEMFREHYRRDKDEASIRMQLQAPVSVRARHALERELSQALGKTPL